MGVTARELEKGAVHVARTLRDAGHEAWFAGGCVRDTLLGKTPKDWDIATDATPGQVQALFRRTIAVGAAFGVVQVLHGKSRAYEVATFRSDGTYVDGRRPAEVRYSTSRQEDVERRDFTINALLMDPFTREVEDFVGGREDLRSGWIRAVGVAQDRFSEDRLRMLRAIRFAARLGFQIEQDTWSAIQTHAAYVGVVSPERITAELEAMLLGPDPGGAFRLLQLSGLGETCLPTSSSEELVGRLHRFQAYRQRVEASKGAGMGWALVYAAEPAEEVEVRLRERKLSRSVIREVQDYIRTAEILESPSGKEPRGPVLRLARGPTAPARQAWLAARFGERSAAVRCFEAAQSRLAAHPPAEGLILTGDDLRGLGIPPGPVYKAILLRVEDAVLEGRLTNREDALDLALRSAEEAAGTGG